MAGTAQAKNDVLGPPDTDHPSDSRTEQSYRLSDLGRHRSDLICAANRVQHRTTASVLSGGYLRVRYRHAATLCERAGQACSGSSATAGACGGWMWPLAGSAGWHLTWLGRRRSPGVAGLRCVWNSSAADTACGLAQISGLAGVLSARSALLCANGGPPGSWCIAGANRYAVPAGWVISCVVLVAAVQGCANGRGLAS